MSAPKIIPVILLCSLLSACNSDGGSGTPPPPSPPGTDPTTHSVGGRVFGLTSGSIVLQNNTADDLDINANGAFTFATKLAPGSAYSVGVVLTNAVPGLVCNLVNAVGAIATFTPQDVDSVRVECVQDENIDNLTITGDLQQLNLSWNPVARAATYRLVKLPPQGAAAIVLEDATTNTNYIYPVVHKLTEQWHSNYTLQACNPAGCVPAGAASAVDIMLTNINYFKASHAETENKLGWNMAMSANGNRLAVSAHLENSAATGVDGNQQNDCAEIPANQLNCASGSGAVYLFSRDSGNWIQDTYLKASNTMQGDEFGYGLALSADGNTLAVGARLENSAAKGINQPNELNDCGATTPTNCSQDSGAVYVFVNNAGVWNQQAYIKAQDAALNDFFGSTVALSSDGSRLAVAALQAGPGSVIGAGKVYLFKRAAGVWSEQTFVQGTTPAASGVYFGIDLAFDSLGQRLLVGAQNEINGTLDESGAAYVYTETADVWSLEQRLMNLAPATREHFGNSVDLSQDGLTLVVGAFGYYRLPGPSVGLLTGAAFIFRYDAVQAEGQRWQQQATITAPNQRRKDMFGRAVKLADNGKALLVGAPGQTGGSLGIQADPTGAGGVFNTGAAYFFKQQADNSWALFSYLKATNANSQQVSNEAAGGLFFGSKVALSEDAQTIAVGSYGESSASRGLNNASQYNCVDEPKTNCSANSGAVYVY